MRIRRTAPPTEVSPVQLIFNIIVFTAIALTVGLGTAWHMIDRGSALSTVHSGPWTAWYAAGMPDADPYTKAHVARAGDLPIVSTSAMRFTARTDSDGEPLKGGCVYAITVPEVTALWWSLALRDASGQPIANPARRHTINSDGIVTGLDGTTRIVISPDARSGYWLPSADAGALMLVFRVFRPFDTADLARGDMPEAILPRIERRACA